MKTFVEWIQNRPHEITEAVRQALLWAIGVGLIVKDFQGQPWTETQTVLTISAVSGVLALIASKSTVAAGKVEERKREAFDKGVAAGVAQASSGAGVSGESITRGLSENGIG